MFIFYGGEFSVLLPQHTSWTITPYKLSLLAYSIHLQLYPISGGLLLHPQPEDNAVVKNDLTLTD
jgi:hypothetical protein